MKRPWEWFRRLVGYEAAPTTEIEGMPFRALGEGPVMPTIVADQVQLEPVPDLQPLRDVEW